MYSAVFSSVAVTAQQDFFEITAPANVAVVLHSVELTQSTEVGDAQEEGLAVLIKRGTSATTSGSGGTAPTAAPLDPGTAAFGGTCEANNTTKMSGGTITTLYSGNWNVRGPFLFLPPPEDRPTMAGGMRFTVELATTPADSITMSGTVVFHTIGG